MKKQNNRLVLCKDDYEVILSCLRSGQNRSAFDRHNAEELLAELKKAKLVDKDNVPQDVVRLNSKVKITDGNKAKVMDVMLVTPDKADIKAGKISIMAPIGIALIGFRRGQKIAWQVPAGKKTFTILAVVNQ